MERNKNKVYLNLSELSAKLNEPNQWILNVLDTVGYKVKKSNGEFLFTTKNYSDLLFIKSIARSENGTIDKARKAFYEKKKIEMIVNKLDLAYMLKSINTSLGIKIYKEDIEGDSIVDEKVYSIYIQSSIRSELDKKLIKKFTTKNYNNE